ncbi:MAG: hypothetical protein HY720_17450 [Planctomycetes bacterium]|nr:hypothetical protein [Planctomycetota bacterium]
MIQRSNEEQVEPPKEDAGGIADAWFMPADRTLRGFYGGAIIRDDLETFAETGLNVPGTLTFNRADQIVTGGDFRMAFYTDGTVKAKWLALNYTPMFSSNVPFCFEGTFTLTEGGEFETGELPLANHPATFLKLEGRMTKMRITGQYDKEKDTFRVQVQTFDPQKGRWDDLGKRIALARAAKRKSYMYGTVKTPGYTQGSSEEDE